MEEFFEYRVADAMTHRPRTVGPKSPLAQVEALFEERGHDCLPVCDQDGCLLGTVTKLDVLSAFASTCDTRIPRYEEIMRQPVELVMTHGAVSVTPDTPLTRVLDLMLVTRNPTVPVTMGRLLLGVVTRRDVLRAVQRADARGSGYLRGLVRVA